MLHCSRKSRQAQRRHAAVEGLAGAVEGPAGGVVVAAGAGAALELVVRGAVVRAQVVKAGAAVGLLSLLPAPVAAMQKAMRLPSLHLLLAVPRVVVLGAAVALRQSSGPSAAA